MEVIILSGLNLQEICNIIILISAVIIAGKNIYAFLKKPVGDLHNFALTNEEKRIKRIIENSMPELLSKHSESVKSERREEIKQMVTEINSSITEPIDDKIEELKEITLDQGVNIKRIQDKIDLISDAQMDVMRFNMNQIYYRYRPYKKILDCDKKAFMKFYNDYHSMGGNTWIDSLYGELKDWDIVEDESELTSQ